MKQQFEAQGGQTVGILGGIAIIAILLCTLWPFNPFPRNNVRWLSAGHGIEFGKHGLVVSRAPLHVPLGDEESEGEESCSLELWLKPGGVDAVYTILSFYIAGNPTQFVVRQYKDGLLVTRDTDGLQNKLKKAKFDVDHAFRRGELRLVTIASGRNGTTVYLDGRLAQAFPRFTISRRELSAQIIMGTSPVHYHPWPGEIRGLAVYSRELTAADASRHYQDWTNPRDHSPDLDKAIAFYAFTEGAGNQVHNEVASEPDLEIPETFSVPHKVMLKSAVKEFEANWNYVDDVATNVAGFVPLGVVICAYLAWTRSERAAVFGTILAGGILSFTIEVLQFYIPRRASGMTDIITNTLGAALGALLVRQSVVRGILQRMRLMPALANEGMDR